ncbi:MAG: PTS sugar transporter subunit IIB [Bacilli bacterium]
MKVVFVLCAGGATSSLIAQKMKYYGNGQNIHVDIDALFALTHVSQTDHFERNGVELLLLYGGAQSVGISTLREYDHLLHGILVAPQVRFFTPQLRKIAEPFSIPVLDMDMRAFGLLNGEAMFADVLHLIGENAIN